MTSKRHGNDNDSHNMTWGRYLEALLSQCVDKYRNRFQNRR